MYPRHIIQDSRAFTLVETLVAIAILMISISGPLAIANKALTASLYAKDQSTASFLAMEEMEIIKNIRNSNSHESKELLSGDLKPACADANNYCELSMANSSTNSLLLNSSTDCTLAGCKLYVTSDSYNFSPIGNPTIFRRYFHLIPIRTFTIPPNTTTEYEYQAVVVVSWNEGTVSNNVTLTDELFSEPP